MVYCEHGNQFDPENSVGDYHDPLDTPLGHHVVMDGTRRIAPFGEISRGLDLSEIKMVYPLVAIPAWIASRYFYNLAGKVASYLLMPLLVAYAIYKVAAYLISRATDGNASLLFGQLPRAAPGTPGFTRHRPFPASCAGDLRGLLPGRSPRRP